MVGVTSRDGQAAWTGLPRQGQLDRVRAEVAHDLMVLRRAAIHGANTRPSICTSSSAVSLGSSPATSTQMDSLDPARCSCRSGQPHDPDRPPVRRRGLLVLVPVVRFRPGRAARPEPDTARLDQKSHDAVLSESDLCQALCLPLHEIREHGQREGVKQVSKGRHTGVGPAVVGARRGAYDGRHEPASAEHVAAVSATQAKDEPGGPGPCRTRRGVRTGEPNGCNKRTVQKWESGLVTTPRGAYARALEFALGEPIENLGFVPADEKYGLDRKLP